MIFEQIPEATAGIEQIRPGPLHCRQLGQGAIPGAGDAVTALDLARTDCWMVIWRLDGLLAKQLKSALRRAFAVAKARHFGLVSTTLSAPSFALECIMWQPSACSGGNFSG